MDSEDIMAIGGVFFAIGLLMIFLLGAMNIGIGIVAGVIVMIGGGIFLGRGMVQRLKQEGFSKFIAGLITVIFAALIIMLALLS